MFGFGRRKDALPAIPFPLHFKDAEAAIKYASEYMVCDLKVGVELPAIVMDASAAFGTAFSVLKRDDGIQTAVLMVCGKPTTFTVISQTSGKYGPGLSPGDLVSWRAAAFMPEVAQGSADRRFGWVGLITGVLSPTLERDGWRGRERFSDRTN